MSKELEGLGMTIVENCFQAYQCTGSEMEHAQVHCVAEEAGEFVGAFRRWKGLARRDGTYEEMMLELADVVIASYAAAAILGIDLDRAIEMKRRKVLTRGWKEGDAAPSPEPQPEMREVLSVKGHYAPCRSCSWPILIENGHLVQTEAVTVFSRDGQDYFTPHGKDCVALESQDPSHREGTTPESLIASAYAAADSGEGNDQRTVESTEDAPVETVGVFGREAGSVLAGGSDDPRYSERMEP